MKATSRSLFSEAPAYIALCALALGLSLSALAHGEPEKPSSQAPGGPPGGTPPKRATPGGPPGGTPPKRATPGTPPGPKGSAPHQGTKSGKEPAQGPGGKSGPTAAREAALRRQAYQKYKRAYLKLTAAEDGKEPDQADRDRANRDLASARRRIVALHKADAKAFKSLPKEQQQEIKSKLKTYRDNLRADRKARAEKERESIQARIGGRAKEKPFFEELRTHAWRLARLNYLVTVAEARNNEEAAKRAKALIEAENLRHEQMLAKLKELPPQPHFKDDEEKDKADSTKGTPTHGKTVTHGKDVTTEDQGEEK